MSSSSPYPRRLAACLAPQVCCHPGTKLRADWTWTTLQAGLRLKPAQEQHILSARRIMLQQLTQAQAARAAAYTALRQEAQV